MEQAPFGIPQRVVHQDIVLDLPGQCGRTLMIGRLGGLERRVDVCAVSFLGNSAETCLFGCDINAVFKIGDGVKARVEIALVITRRRVRHPRARLQQGSHLPGFSYEVNEVFDVLFE